MSELPSPHEWAARVATVLDGLTDLTGDARFRRAAGVLRGKRLGRLAVDDRKALALMKSFLHAGLARSPTDAARRAAVLMVPANQIETAIRRLQRKFQDESYLSRDKDARAK